MFVLSWDGIVARFELKFDEVFNAEKSKAFFDTVSQIVDGPKNSWKFIVLLDAVVCYHNMKNNNAVVRANSSRKFDQHAMLKLSILKEFKDVSGSDEHYEGDGSEISLDVDASWLSIKKINSKLLEEDSAGKNMKSVLKRQLVVEALCTNLGQCGDLKSLFENVVRSICIAGEPIEDPASNPAPINEAVKVPEQIVVNVHRLKTICSLVYKSIQKERKNARLNVNELMKRRLEAGRGAGEEGDAMLEGDAAFGDSLSDFARVNQSLACLNSTLYAVGRPTGLDNEASIYDSHMDTVEGEEEGVHAGEKRKLDEDGGTPPLSHRDEPDSADALSR